MSSKGPHGPCKLPATNKKKTTKTSAPQRVRPEARLAQPAVQRPAAAARQPSLRPVLCSSRAPGSQSQSEAQARLGPPKIAQPRFMPTKASKRQEGQEVAHGKQDPEKVRCRCSCIQKPPSSRSGHSAPLSRPKSFIETERSDSAHVFFKNAPVAGRVCRSHSHGPPSYE